MKHYKDIPREKIDVIQHLNDPFKESCSNLRDELTSVNLLFFLRLLGQTACFKYTALLS